MTNCQVEKMMDLGWSWSTPRVIIFFNSSLPIFPNLVATTSPTSNNNYFMTDTRFSAFSRKSINKSERSFPLLLTECIIVYIIVSECIIVYECVSANGWKQIGQDLFWTNIIQMNIHDCISLLKLVWSALNILIIKKLRVSYKNIYIIYKSTDSIVQLWYLLCCDNAK